MPVIPAIRFDPQSDVPAVRQISDSLRVLLVDRNLPPGAVLPSVRRLAIELGVHFNTVAAAYRQLANEGWLEVHHGRGAVVIPRPAPAGKSAPRLSAFRNKLRTLVAQMKAEGAPANELAAELKAMAKAVKQS